jgi:hypothetical protein
VISFIIEDEAAAKYYHNLTGFFSESIFDIWTISKLRRMNPSLLSRAAFDRALV